jgi:DNA primase
VRAATNIVEVIGEHLPLTAAGRSYKALCPFHEEKTPSFIVTPDRQTYHCFGCGAGGNVFTFLMKHQGLEFREAIDLLAARAGIALPRSTASERSDSGAAALGPGRLLAAIEEATRLYERNLWELEGGTRARAYLVERGLGEETARSARLGYAPPGFDYLRQRLGRTHGLGTLVGAGLLVDRGEGSNYDRFRDRLMFPILGAAGRPVGFGARSLDGSEPKYLNSPETAVYHKREVLYGLPAARPSLARQGTAWVVEGYMDVLALQQAGFGGVVGVSGTALTDRHARLLGRHVRRVLLLFDGDDAGRGAILRSLPPLLAEGLEVKVALIAGEEDPDTLVRKGGPAAVQKVVDEATTVLQFVVSHCHRSRSKEEARGEALRQLVHLGALLPDRVGRRLFAEEAARRLSFDEATLAGEIETSRTGRKPGPGGSGQSGQSSRLDEAPGPAGQKGVGAGVAPRPDQGTSAVGTRGARARAERMLLAMAIGKPRVVRRIRQELAAEDFVDPGHRRLIELLFVRETGNQSIRPADLVGPDEDPAIAALVSALAVDLAADEEREGAADELIAKLRDQRRRQEITQLRELIREHEAAGRREEIEPLLERVQSLIQSEGREGP